MALGGTAAERAQTFRGLEWMRYYDFKGKQWHARAKQRLPGWAAREYREMFGRWPEDWMKDLTPMEPSDDLRKSAMRRINQFKREKKRERQAANGTVPTSSSSSKRNARPGRPGDETA